MTARLSTSRLGHKLDTPTQGPEQIAVEIKGKPFARQRLRVSWISSKRRAEAVNPDEL
jgi:hypothetical protein